MVTWWPATVTVTFTGPVAEGFKVTVTGLDSPALSEAPLSLRLMGPDFDADQVTGPSRAVSVTVVLPGPAARSRVNDLGLAVSLPSGTGAGGGAFVVGAGLGGGFGGGFDPVGVGSVVVAVEAGVSDGASMGLSHLAPLDSLGRNVSCGPTMYDVVVGVADGVVSADLSTPRSGSPVSD